jgi:hypothetical protein
VSATAWVKCQTASVIMQAMGSSSSGESDNNLARQSRKGATQLTLRSVKKARISSVEASLSDRPSGIEWKVKLGWLEEFGELKWV